MSAGGTNGTVTGISTTATQTNVTVSFPADPGPPPVAAHVETYEDVKDPFLRTFEAAKAPIDKVNVTVDGAGKCNGVGAHS